MTIYVDSAAAGANNGTSWTDAYTDIQSADSVAAAGEEIWISHTHSQTFSGTTTLGFSNGTAADPVKVLSVNKSDDSLASGATINWGGTTYDNIITGYVYVNGVTFDQLNDFYMVDTLPGFQHYYNCTFNFVSSAEFRTGGDAGSIIIFESCTIDFSGSSSISNVWVHRFTENCFTYVINCTITARTGTDPLVYNPGGAGESISELIFTGCDVSGFDSVVDWSSVVTSPIILRGCKVSSAMLVDVDGTLNNPAAIVIMENCDDGTITVPAHGLSLQSGYYGTVATTTARYRTGGADDGEQANAVSWEMAANANCTPRTKFALVSPPMVRWVDGGSSLTFTIYIASDATLQNDEFWIELMGPDSAVSATAQWDYDASTRAAFRSTAANITSDGTSAWTGTGTTTAQKVSATYTPTIAGPVVIRACFAPSAADTVYVDPRIEVV